MEKKRSHAEGMRLAEEFDKSGQSRREFSARRNIGVTTLDYWREKKRVSAKARFREVAIEPEAPGPGFAIALCNGRRIECSWDFCESALATLIGIVESARCSD